MKRSLTRIRGGILTEPAAQDNPVLDRPARVNPPRIAALESRTRRAAACGSAPRRTALRRSAGSRVFDRKRRHGDRTGSRHGFAPCSLARATAAAKSPRPMPRPKHSGSTKRWLSSTQRGPAQRERAPRRRREPAPALATRPALGPAPIWSSRICSSFVASGHEAGNRSPNAPSPGCRAPSGGAPRPLAPDV